jgi:hypothetical protein
VLHTFTVADFISIAAGNPHQAVNVNWALTAGQSYFLVQFARGNALFTPYGQALPSDGDIKIVRSSVFGRGLGQALTDSSTPNAYWADFNAITTSSAAVPEPAGWALMILGMGLAGAGLRRRKISAI